MSTLYKEYQTIEINGEKQEIKFCVSFNKDRYNWATNQPKKIGYQITVLPVKRTSREGGIVIEESEAFTGFNDCLLQVDRQSQKRLKTALLILQNSKEKYLSYFTQSK